MDKNILKIYGLTGAYCKFMGITKMPKFKVKTFKGGNASAYISYQNNSQIFNIEENYINVLKQNALPLIYHEFTHIVDNESFLPEVSAKTKIPFIKMLSEYRAIQVQMKISMNFETYNEDKKFSFDLSSGYASDKANSLFNAPVMAFDASNSSLMLPAVFILFLASITSLKVFSSCLA